MAQFIGGQWETEFRSVGGNGIEVWGEHDGAGYGVYGSIRRPVTACTAATAAATHGVRGLFQRRVQVNGTLSKGGGSFKIDHPLDPANKYLCHSFVESPDMMNIYNGNVTTDDGGGATVELPDWFEALNRDFRYQLTVIGQFAQAIVAEEIGQPLPHPDRPAGRQGSWQVTGIRQDPYAEATASRSRRTSRGRARPLPPPRALRQIGTGERLVRLLAQRALHDRPSGGERAAGCRRATT